MINNIVQLLTPRTLQAKLGLWIVITCIFIFKNHDLNHKNELYVFQQYSTNEGIAVIFPRARLAVLLNRTLSWFFGHMSIYSRRIVN